MIVGGNKVLFKYVILTSFSRLQNERSITNIYHLLTGRRSIQTILDASLFQLQSYYGIYQTLNKQTFEAYITQLVDDKLLCNKQTSLCLSNVAVQWICNQDELKEEVFLKGDLYRTVHNDFYFRLLLLIQVWTNQRMNNNTYFPVIENKMTEQWVKRYYVRTKNNIHSHLYQLHNELIRILQTVSNRQANMFVDRLTGYERFGLSSNQLATKYGLTNNDVHLHLISVIHKIIDMSKHNKQHFPQLYYLFSDLLTKKVLSNSSQQTKSLLDRGLSAEQIALKRRLSINTIYDHIVEIALHQTDFPYDHYVTKEDTQLILTVVNNLNTFRLKEIKQAVPEEITYFQIRLILTKLRNKE